MLRKRPKLFVPEGDKDDRYWEKRSKNNVAARRSREARRLKENQIALRCVHNTYMSRGEIRGMGIVWMRFLEVKLKSMELKVKVVTQVKLVA